LPFFDKSCYDPPRIPSEGGGLSERSLRLISFSKAF